MRRVTKSKRMFLGAGIVCLLVLGCTANQWLDTPWACWGTWYSPGGSSNDPFGGGGGGGMTCGPNSTPNCQDGDPNAQNSAGGGHHPLTDPYVDEDSGNDD